MRRTNGQGTKAVNKAFSGVPLNLLSFPLCSPITATELQYCPNLSMQPGPVKQLGTLFRPLSIRSQPTCAFFIVAGEVEEGEGKSYWIRLACVHRGLQPQMWLVNCTSKEDKSTQQYFIHQGNLQWITASLWLRLFLIYCFYSVFNHKWAPYEAFTMQNWQLFLSAWKIFLDNNLWLGNILRSFNSYIIFIQCLMMQGLPV